MFGLFYRQRRRFLFGWFFFLLTVMSLILSDGGAMIWDGEQPEAWSLVLWWAAIGAAAIALNGAIFIGIAIFILALPRWRHIVELAFFWVFIEATLRPSSALTDIAGLPDQLAGFISFFLFIALYSLTYGKALDRFRFRLDWTTKRRVHVPLAPEEIWPAFCLAEHGTEANWVPILHHMKPDPEEPGSFDVTYTLGPSVYQHQTQTVLECDAAEHYRYHFIGDIDSENRSLTEGVFDARLQADGKGGTSLTVYQHNTAMRPKTALSLWFDDQLGDALDSFVARRRGKHDWSMTGVTYREILSLS